MNFLNKLNNYYLAGAKLIQVITCENTRLHGELIKLSVNNDLVFYVWNRIEGIKKWEDGHFSEEAEDAKTPESIFAFYHENMEEDAILLLEDFHPDLSSDFPYTIKRLQLISEVFNNTSSKAIILSQPCYSLPVELEKAVITLELELPDINDIEAIFDDVIKKHKIPTSKIERKQALFDAVLGLTTNEIHIAFSKAFVMKKRLTDLEIPLLVEEKENIIKKSGYLEYYHPQENFDDVGGLENLKDWLQKRGRGFSNEAKEYGLESPKGALLLGIPGTGKSLTAKAVASMWKFPLLRLDIGKVFGGIVGQSEENIRKSLQIAESLSPSILWIDEIEKGLSGFASSGSTDGGTTSRVLGTFLTWMQEKENDEIFFVDLPGEQARKDILNIHLKKKERDPESFNIESLSEKCIGFSGAEIAEAINEAMYTAFYDESEIDTDDISAAIDKTYPLSRTMGEIIKGTREWAKHRAVFASEEQCDFKIDEKSNSKPKLKQEYNNPFVRNKE